MINKYLLLKIGTVIDYSFMYDTSYVSKHITVRGEGEPTKLAGVSGEHLFHELSICQYTPSDKFSITT